MTTYNKEKGEEEYQPKLDILLNCAAVVFAGDLDTTFPQDYDYLQDLNVRAPWVLINFFQDMLIAGQGCVVNMSCIKGSKPQPGLIGYCMAKAGLESVTKSAAVELARFGVRVNAVSSSFLNTNMYRTAGLTDLDYSSMNQKEADTNPMGRPANVEEVCQAVVHLTSQHARMMTGQILHVDGGKHNTVRGQQSWYGMKQGNAKAFEVGESSSLPDLLRGLKMQAKNGGIVNQYNTDINSFVEQNSTSLWAKKDEEAHIGQTYTYNRPEDLDNLGVHKA